MKVTYYTLPPPPALREVVRFYWVFEISGLNGAPYIYRSMADGCAELVFHYKGPFQELRDGGRLAETLSTLHAQTAVHRRFEVREDFGIFGAYLYPFAIPRLFGFPATDFTNAMPELHQFLGNSGSDLEEQILVAQDNMQRSRILSHFLLTRLQAGKPRNETAEMAIRLLLNHKGDISIHQLADYLSVSLRHLERQFKDLAGFSPKTYSRILRFQSAVQAFGSADKTLTELALDCGYYDQAHFIHDFRQFSGYSPKEYFRGRPEGVEYREA